MSQRTPRVRPPGLREAARWVSGGGTALAGLTVLAIGALSLAQAHGRFSIGVGLMLFLYGVLVLLLGVAALRGVAAVRGAVVAAGLLHVIVVASLAANGAPALWGLELPLLISLGAAVMLIPPPKDSAPAPES